MPVTDSPIQAPILRGVAKELDRHRFRKQILPVGRVTHPEMSLNFDRRVLQGLANNFMNRAYDQVPFVLVDDLNMHTDDPERFRGEVVDMAVEDDGLYATFAMTERGAALIRDNPHLGVSPRLIPKPAPGSSTPRKWPAIAHVAGTLFPRADGMKPWEGRYDLSSRGSTVVDLTASDYGITSRSGETAEQAERRRLVEAWGASLGEAPEPQPVELSNMATNPAKAMAERWEWEVYGR